MIYEGEQTTNEVLRIDTRKAALKLALGIPTGKTSDLDWVTETAAKFEEYLLHGRKTEKGKDA